LSLPLRPSTGLFPDPAAPPKKPPKILKVDDVGASDALEAPDVGASDALVVTPAGVNGTNAIV